MKRVNLLNYFELAETLHSAKQGLAPTTLKGGTIYFSIMSLPDRLTAFVADDNGFSACKHAASDLNQAIQKWINMVVPNGQFSTEEFDREYQSWQYYEISRAIDTFRSVFQAECRDVDVYSVGQIGIYRTSALVSAGANILPQEFRARLPDGASEEFTNAAKCLAFDLPTACGFHALRGLELVMDEYLSAFGVVTAKFKSWNDYIVAAQKLVDDEKATLKPSAKVAAMLDRMRQLDRNPLMHPRDTLDTIGADQLFKLSAVTVVEMVRDMPKTDEETTDIVKAIMAQ